VFAAFDDVIASKRIVAKEFEMSIKHLATFVAGGAATAAVANTLTNRKKIPMSKSTTVNKSQLFAAATAISALGLLTAPATAQAYPIVPLAPDCHQYGFPQWGFTITQSNGLDVYFLGTGKIENSRRMGALSNDGSKQAVGNIDRARIDGRGVDFTIVWDNGQTGVYNGSVDADGFARGDGYEQANPSNTTHWQSKEAFPCNPSGSGR
jgi:hypothetical protein